MRKFKLFIENFLIYGLGGIISKIIPLIMVPIVTRLMPSSEYYGLSDMSHTVMNFCVYLAVFGMYDAMYRMFFEKQEEYYKRKVCSTAFLFNICMSVCVCVLMIVFREWIAQMFFNDQKYSYLVCLTAIATLVGGTNNIISAPTRMQNKRTVFLVTNTIGPIISYAISIPLLINGYYVIALPLASLISCLTIEIAFWVMNRNWFTIGLFDKMLLKELLKIAIPLFPNFLVYWIFNSCDRVMITKLQGIGAAGIYSVGAKLGMASQLIYTAFAGGWQFFAFSTMNEENQVESNSKVFEYLGCISFACTLFICAWAESIYKLLFTEEYHSAFIVSPYLFLAPLLQMLFQVACNQFLVIKKTWPNILILSIGAIANILINFGLIPQIGIEGAALATLIGYAISVVICVIILLKMKLMVISRKFVYVTCIMVGALLIWRFVLLHHVILSSMFALAIMLLILFIYRQVLIDIFSKIKRKNV